MLALLLFLLSTWAVLGNLMNFLYISVYIYIYI